MNKFGLQCRAFVLRRGAGPTQFAFLIWPTDCAVHFRKTYGVTRLVFPVPAVGRLPSARARRLYRVSPLIIGTDVGTE